MATKIIDFPMPKISLSFNSFYEYWPSGWSLKTNPIPVRPSYFCINWGWNSFLSFLLWYICLHLRNDLHVWCYLCLMQILVYYGMLLSSINCIYPRPVTTIIFSYLLKKGCGDRIRLVCDIQVSGRRVASSNLPWGSVTFHLAARCLLRQPSSMSKASSKTYHCG